MRLILSMLLGLALVVLSAYLFDMAAALASLIAALMASAGFAVTGENLTLVRMVAATLLGLLTSGLLFGTIFILAYSLRAERSEGERR